MAGQKNTAYDCGGMNLGLDNSTYEPVTIAFTRQIDSGNSKDPGSLWHLIVNALTRAPMMSLKMTMSTVDWVNRTRFVNQYRSSPPMPVVTWCGCVTAS